MTILKLLKILIVAWPEISQLIRTINAKYDEAALDTQIKKDLGAINEAFKNKDPEALRAVFNS